MFAQGCQGSCRRRRRERRKRGAARVRRQKMKESMTGRMEQSVSVSFVQLEFVQLSQQAALSVRIRSTDCDQLSTRLEEQFE